MPESLASHLAPLQLKRHIFKTIRIQANENPHLNHNFNLRLDNGWEPVPGQKDNYHLFVRARIEKEADKVPPFEIEVEVHGYFQVLAQYPEDEKTKLVVINGSTILWASIREMVCNLTARSIHPMLTLASVRFQFQPPDPTQLPKT